MPEDYKIQYSERADGQQNLNLEDYVPEALIKVYPYRAINGNKNKTIIQSNTHTIIRLSQDAVEDFKHLKIDKGPTGIEHLYFNIFAAIDDETRMTTSSNTSSFQKEIRKMKTFTAITNSYIPTEDDKPDFFTIGQPFNKDLYEKDLQVVYYGSESKESYGTNLILDLTEQGFDIQDTDKLGTITLNDVSELEKQVSHSRLLFTLDNALFKNPKVTFLDKSGKVVIKSGIGIEFDKHALVNDLKAKGSISIANKNGSAQVNHFSEISLLSNETVVPFKMTPISVKDKVTMYADWFDYDNVMPEFIATQFKGGNLIQEIKEKIDYKLINNVNFPIKNNLWKNKETIEIAHNKLEKDFVLSHFYIDLTIGIGQTATGVNLWLENTLEWNGKAKIGDKIVIDDSSKIEIEILKDKFILKNISPKPWADLKIKGPLKILWLVGAKKLLKEEDIKLIEDCISLSAGAADQWNAAPVYDSSKGSAAGKIKSDFRIGHRGFKVTSIGGKNPRSIIDGWIIEHELKYPSFRRDLSRYLGTKSIINALSRYIFSSSNSTHGGASELNSVTLPWYLELNGTTKIEYAKSGNEQQIISEDGAKKEKTFLLPGTKYDLDKNTSFGSGLKSLSKISWNIRTNYFKDNYTDKIDYESRFGIVLPKNVNFSNDIMLQTDRKIILPKIGDNISSIKKSFLPGDIKGSEEDFKYVFNLPIQEKNIFKRMFLDIFGSNHSYVKNDTLTIQLPRTKTGVIRDSDWAKKEIKKMYPNSNFVIEPKAKKISSFTGTIKGDYRRKNHWFSFIGNFNLGSSTHDVWTYIVTEKGTKLFEKQMVWATDLFKGDTDKEKNELLSKIKDDSLITLLSKHLNSNKEQFVITSNNLKVTTQNYSNTNGGGFFYVYSGSATYEIAHTEFTEAEIIFTADQTIKGSAKEYKNRQVLFDKAEWQAFIDSYDITNSRNISYHLYEENSAIFKSKVDLNGNTVLVYDSNNEVIVEKHGNIIKEIDEIIIGQLWGDYITIYADGTLPTKIPMINKFDETIGIQKIAFF